MSEVRNTHRGLVGKAPSFGTSWGWSEEGVTAEEKPCAAPEVRLESRGVCPAVPWHSCVEAEVRGRVQRTETALKGDRIALEHCRGGLM